jgi:hypothetical protein
MAYVTPATLLLFLFVTAGCVGDPQQPQTRPTLVLSSAQAEPSGASAPYSALHLQIPASPASGQVYEYH